MANDRNWFRRRSGKDDSLRTAPCCSLTGASSKPKYADYESTSENSGEGNFANVQVLKRRRDGAVFALKTFKPMLVSSRTIQAELCVARGMRHQNIIETYELLEFRGSQGILMEYAPRCLLDLVTSRALKRGGAEIYLQQILADTAYIHERGFAHRDLKLENIVLGSHGQAKIIDFGSVGTAKMSRPTNIGSLPYMSPELFKTHVGYDPRLADLWSIGILYTFMVLVRFPWAVARCENPAFAAYTKDDRRIKHNAAFFTTDALTGQWPYPFKMLTAPLMRSILYGMLRVIPSQRVSLSKTL